MINGHKIEMKIEENEFLDLIQDKEDINISNHALFRYKKEDKKIYQDMVEDFIKNKKPFLVGLQYNQKYAVFYKYEKNDIFKVIIDIRPNSINIVTFYIIDSKQIPRI